MPRLHIENIDDTDMDEKILKCYAESFDDIFVTGENKNMDENAKLLMGEDLPRPTIYDSLHERRKGTICREYCADLDENDGGYLLDQHAKQSM